MAANSPREDTAVSGCLRPHLSRKNPPSKPEGPDHQSASSGRRQTICASLSWHFYKTILMLQFAERRRETSSRSRRRNHCSPFSLTWHRATSAIRSPSIAHADLGRPPRNCFKIIVPSPPHSAVPVSVVDFFVLIFPTIRAENPAPACRAQHAAPLHCIPPFLLEQDKLPLRHQQIVSCARIASTMLRPWGLAASFANNCSAGGFRQFQRDLPWRDEDPYRQIGLSGNHAASNPTLRRRRDPVLTRRFSQRAFRMFMRSPLPPDESAAVMVGARLLQPRAQPSKAAHESC